MPVDTKAIACPAGQYTVIATDKSNCSIQLRTVGAGRLVIAASAPAAGITDYVTVTSDRGVDIGSMSGTEDVYFMPEGTVAITVAVMRG